MIFSNGEFGHTDLVCGLEIVQQWHWSGPSDYPVLRRFGQTGNFQDRCGGRASPIAVCAIRAISTGSQDGASIRAMWQVLSTKLATKSTDSLVELSFSS